MSSAARELLPNASMHLPSRYAMGSDMATREVPEVPLAAYPANHTGVAGVGLAVGLGVGLGVGDAVGLAWMRA